LALSVHPKVTPGRRPPSTGACTCMQMSWGDMGRDGNGGGAPPGWAVRANEPLVPSLDVAAVKKSVLADVKELHRAVSALEKLANKAKKNPNSAVGEQLLSISAAARERARTTSRTLRTALGMAEEGSADHKTLTALSDEFKQALVNFQRQVEASSYLVPPPPVAPLSAAGPSGVGDVESGPPSGGIGMPAGNHGWGDGGGGEAGGACGQSAQQQQQQQQYDEHMGQVAANDAIIAEREQGIGHLARSVQEVADIYQDLALLVQEQGTQIDNIQTNIEAAATQTEKGVRELHRANRSQQKTRSRMCIVALCIMAVMVVLVLVLKFGMGALR